MAETGTMFREIISHHMKLFRFEKTLFDREVEGLSIQVVERGSHLELRFGNHIVQSARSLPAPDVLVLDYTRAMMAGLLFMPRPERVLHFGLGGGSLAGFLHNHLHFLRQQVVEINQGVIDVAYRFFQLPVSNRLEVIHQNGIDFLQGQENLEPASRYDMIFMDAFHADGAEPHLNTGSIYRRLKSMLTSQGWLINNVWGSDKENLSQVRRNMAAQIDNISYVSVRSDSNVIFIASPSETPPSLSLLRKRASLLSGQFPLDFENLVQKIRPLQTAANASAQASRGGG